MIGRTVIRRSRAKVPRLVRPGRFYGLFLAKASEKIEVLEPENSEFLKAVDQLKIEQRERVFTLSGFKQDISSTKRVLLEIVGETGAADPEIVVFVCKVVNQLKNREDVNGVKKHVSSVAQMFSEEEMITILEWIGRQRSDRVYESKEVKKVVAELFRGVQNRELIDDGAIDGYRVFNKVLMLLEYFAQVVYNCRELIGKLGAKQRQHFCEKLAADLEDVNVKNAYFVLELAKLFELADFKNSSLGWIKRFMTVDKSMRVSSMADDAALSELRDLEDTFVEMFSSMGLKEKVAILELLELEDKPHQLELLRGIKDGIQDVAEKDVAVIVDRSIRLGDPYLVVEGLVNSVGSALEAGQPVSKVAVDDYLSWQVYKGVGNAVDARIKALTGKANELKVHKEIESDAQEYVYEAKDRTFVDEETLNKMLLAAAKSAKLQEYIESLISWFESDFEVEVQEMGHAILMERAIELGSRDLVWQSWQKSLDSGVRWDNENNKKCDNIIFKLVRFQFTLAASLAEVEDSFKFLVRTRSFIGGFDVDTLDTVLRKFLEYDCVGDALEFLSQEFISTEDTSSSKYFGKMNEEDIFDLENLALNKRKIDLNLRASHKIYCTLHEFILRNTHGDVCWVVYGAIHRMFIGVPQDLYLEMMKKFNALGQPNASLAIFKQMKKINRLFGLAPPGNAHYKYLLDTYGDMCYETGIVELHTMLKLDVVVDADIGLNNALLSAYTNLQDVMKSRDLFERMVCVPADSKNAINTRTINTMIKAHTYASLGQVKHFWNNLSQLHYIPTSHNYKQFIVSHCYYGKHQEAVALVDEMAYNGMEVDQDVVGEILRWSETEEDKSTVRLLLQNKGYGDVLRLAEAAIKEEGQNGVKGEENTVIRQ